MSKFDGRKKFRRRLRFLMWRDDLTLGELSKLTGIKYQTLANMTSDGCVPVWENMVKICAAFKVSPAWMLGEEELSHVEAA